MAETLFLHTPLGFSTLRRGYSPLHSQSHSHLRSRPRPARSPTTPTPTLTYRLRSAFVPDSPAVRLPTPAPTPTNTNINRPHPSTSTSTSASTSVYRLQPLRTRPLVGQIALCAAALVVDPLMGLIDTFWVARLSPMALAALSPCTTVFNVIATLFAASVAGATTLRVAASLHGVDTSVEGDEKGEDRPLPTTQTTTTATTTTTTTTTTSTRHTADAVGAAVVVTTFLAVLLTIPLVLFPGTVLRYAGASTNLAELGAPYLALRGLAVVPLSLFVVLQGCSNAKLDLMRPLRSIIVGAVLNAVLDPLFMHVWAGGLTGAALATLLAEVAQLTYLAHVLPSAHPELVVRTGTVDTPHRDDVEGAIPPPPTSPTSPTSPTTTPMITTDGAGPPGDKIVRRSLGFTAWVSYYETPPKQMVLEFAQDVGTLAIRAVAVVLTYAMCGVTAARASDAVAAAHHLVLSIQSTFSIAGGAFTTVATAITAQARGRGGTLAARQAVATLLRVSVVASLVLATGMHYGGIYLVRILAGPGMASTVLGTAGAAVALPAAIMTLLLWFKTIEGALLAMDDGFFMSMTFIPAMLACAGFLPRGVVGLAHPHILLHIWGTYVVFLFVLLVLREVMPPWEGHTQKIDTSSSVRVPTRTVFS